MPFQIGHQKVGGRKKGSVNLSVKPVKLILSSIFPEDVQQRDWKKWLNHPDQHIAFEAFKLSQAYLHGKPAQAVEDNGEVTEMNFETLPAPDESRTADKPN